MNVCVFLPCDGLAIHPGCFPAFGIRMYTQTATILLEAMAQTDHIYANKLAAEKTLHQI